MLLAMYSHAAVFTLEKKLEMPILEKCIMQGCGRGRNSRFCWVLLLIISCWSVATICFHQRAGVAGCFKQAPRLVHTVGENLQDCTNGFRSRLMKKSTDHYI